MFIRKYLEFIKEGLERSPEDIKEYFYDLIEDGVQYEFTTLRNGHFCIEIFNTDEQKSQIESIVNQINDIEDFKVILSDIQIRGLYIFDLSLVQKFDYFFKDIKVCKCLYRLFN